MVQRRGDVQPHLLPGDEVVVTQRAVVGAFAWGRSWKRHAGVNAVDNTSVGFNSTLPLTIRPETLVNSYFNSAVWEF